MTGVQTCALPICVSAEVNDLREGLEMVEEKARSELGMLRPDEVLVQMTKRR